MKGRRVSSSRTSRRIFAKKTQPSRAALVHAYLERGGGYL